MRFFDLFYLLSSFVSLPRWLQGTVYVIAALSVLGISFAFSPMIALIAGIGILVVAVALGIYFLVVKRRREREQAALGGELQKNAQSTPQAINDPARKARLEDLRNRFQEGLSKFKSVGKDLYKLPWYVIIGEPAAGKSEAIRRCDVGFPPGMQDEYQGVGGTINMNWWFTNHAVILDTAGRLLFEEAPAGTTTEWKEFLRLLRKHRPNCPFNGLILVIPADSLVKDSEKEIHERAGRIATQLENIQRELDIRFPVYVVISKCDLLNGFREFFEDVTEPEAQRQMLGWSNPDPLDTAFRPELLDQHLTVVVKRLRERRLGLMVDPVARDSSHRRTDEVDRLYAFPHSIALIASSLRQYFTTIFVAGEWSAKPLFLRGVYFTSSLQEGAELDQELAQAAGVPIDQLPAGRAWERERTFFLRDLFLEKMFREWGLVTRASNTVRMLRRRHGILLGSCVLALCVWLLLSWFGYSAMKNSIGRQSGYWLRASEDWSREETWMPIVASTSSGFSYKGDEPVGPGTRTNTRNLFRAGDESLVDFHSNLQDLSVKPLQIAWIFRPFYSMIGKFETERQRAQRIVLDGSVVKPLLDSTRTKVRSRAAPVAEDFEPVAKAVRSLILVEADIVRRQRKLDEQISPPDEVLAPLQTYVVPDAFSPKLGEVTEWTYSEGGGKGEWPADWMSGGATLVSGRTDYNESLDAGLERFRQTAIAYLSESTSKLEMLVGIRDYLKENYGPREQALFAAAQDSTPDIRRVSPVLDSRYGLFVEARNDLAEQINAARSAGAFVDDDVSLVAAYERVKKEWLAQVADVQKWIIQLVAAATVLDPKNPEPSPLLAEVRERLSAIEGDIRSELTDIDVATFKAADADYMGSYREGVPFFAFRASMYERSNGAIHDTNQFQNLIGKKWAPLEEAIGDVLEIRQQLARYDGPFREQTTKVCNEWLDVAEATQATACINAYISETRAQLTPLLKFPIVWPPEPQGLSPAAVRQAAKLVNEIVGDLQAPLMSKLSPQVRRPLEGFAQRIGALDSVVDALVLPDGSISHFKLSMIPPPPTAPARKAPAGFAYELREGTPTSGTHGNLGGQGKVPVGTSRLLADHVPADTVFHFHSWLGDGWKEVYWGNDWSAIRLLEQVNDKSEFTQDGAFWTIRVDDPNGPVYFYLEFDRRLPKLPRWPRSGSLDR